MRAIEARDPVGGMMKTAAWHTEQRATIGGSTAPLLLDWVPRSITRGRPGPVVAYERMTGRQDPDQEEDPSAARGRLFEDDAIEILAEASVEVIPHDQLRFLYRDELPWAHALPDAWTRPRPEVATPVEIKWPDPAVWRRVQDEGVTDAHWCQCQHTLAVTQADRMPIYYFHCVFPTVFLGIWLERDDEFLARLMELESSFFAAIQEGTFDAWLSDYYPVVDRTVPAAAKPKGRAVIREDERAVDLAREYQRAARLLEQAQRLEQRGKNRLMECCADPLTEIRADGKRVLRVHNRPGYRRIRR